MHNANLSILNGMFCKCLWYKVHCERNVCFITLVFNRVSLIVIDKITVDPNNGVVTGVRDWIEMMSSVDSIDNLFLIFLVEAEEFYQIDITTFSKMRTLVNQGLSELMRRRVLW